MERFDYQHLDALVIESVGNALRLDYSEPDQGGTRLLHRFRIPSKGEPELETGYAHDSSLSRKTIPFTDIPGRVLRDAETWIEQQRRIAESKKQTDLVKALLCFGERLRRQ